MKVFLSSTGRDLTTYREAAFKAIFKMDYHCVRMEDFCGPAEKIEHFDNQKIADCDLFVIVLGHLHGTCPDGREESYTELEYDAAQKLAKPTFIFLAPEDFSFPASLIEPDAKRLRQRAFRERAVKGVIRNSFTDEKDLATQIVSAIHNWRAAPLKPDRASCRIRRSPTSRTRIHCKTTSRAGSPSAGC